MASQDGRIRLFALRSPESTVNPSILPGPYHERRSGGYDRDHTLVTPRKTRPYTTLSASPGHENEGIRSANPGTYVELPSEAPQRPLAHRGRWDRYSPGGSHEQAPLESAPGPAT